MLKPIMRLETFFLLSRRQSLLEGEEMTKHKPDQSSLLKESLQKIAPEKNSHETLEDDGT